MSRPSPRLSGFVFALLSLTVVSAALAFAAFAAAVLGKTGHALAFGLTAWLVFGLRPQPREDLDKETGRGG